KTARCATIEILEAGHPVPDERSVSAANKILSLAAKVREWESRGEHCLVIMLVSGGGSALLCAPLPGITLQEKALTTQLLLGSGATIQEMNAVRKHLSAVKGGKLAQAFAPAEILSLVLSDVIGDDLDAIASGPTVPDNSTWQMVHSILAARNIMEQLPASVRNAVQNGAAGKIPETPKLLGPNSKNSVFNNTKTVLIGNNMLALRSARQKAEALGYKTFLLTSRLTGEAREMARLFSALASDVAEYGIPLARPACLIAGGETTVTLRGTGLGGRNQEMALAVLTLLDEKKPGHRDAVFLSAGTDGNDGPTDAAGAFASMELKMVAEQRGLSALEYLQNNDSYHFFEQIDGLLKTGPSGTNVCDMQILIVP
ncbi:MAG: DUF4147 domain-containing protein, partial [Spirochaetia bacterium]|nr:DUF4147 domain-containing protein [Spirochaetia bacterium]